MKKLSDILHTYQSYLIGLAIFFSLLAESITISGGEVKLNLQNYPVLMILMVVLSILLVIIYIQIDTQKIKGLSEQILEQSEKGNDEFESSVAELTKRQKEIYEQIVSGKSNKEIMSELFIEQSTLKTHINHIYKKLNISPLLAFPFLTMPPTKSQTLIL